MAYPTTFNEYSTSSSVVITMKDERAIEYWNIVKDDVTDIYDSVIVDQVFGINNTCRINLLMLYQTLFWYLEFIQEVREEYITNNGSDASNRTWNDEYCIDNIKKTMLCHGMKSVTMQSILELYNLTDKETSTNDGINYMSIEGTSSEFVVN